MADKSYTLDISTLIEQLPAGSRRTLGEDFVLAELDYDIALDFMRYPVRFNGFVIFFCTEGRFNLDINLESYEVNAGSLIIYTPGNIARVTAKSCEELDKIRFITAAFSEDFISASRFDFNKLYEDSLMTLYNPCITLNREERGMLRKYFNLAESLLGVGDVGYYEAVKSLVASALHLLGSIWKKRLEAARSDEKPRKIRSYSIFENFLKLVFEHHSTQHNVSFYSDKLFLTPKYLSKLVKETSGRSAPEWIDSFNILEAKNLLKYSNLSIKEIAFNMHFSTVPSFYKFFKKQTGMTPAEYREM